jgi:hypothetical protein
VNGYRPALAKAPCLVFCLAVAAAMLPAAARASDVHGVVDTTVQCLLGASEAGRWLGAEAAAPKLTDGEAYALVGIDGVGPAVRGSAAKFAGEPCKETLTVDLSALQEPEAPTIAVGAPAWPLQPRPVARLDTDNPAYVSAVREILVGNGIARPKVRLAQVLRSDLDGNGTDEVLIAASRYGSDPPPPDSRPGDYALVMIRQIINGQVTTLMLHEQYHTRAREFSAPDAYVFAAVTDLNGDGVMEVVVRGRYYEGEWSDVFQVKEGRLETVLTCGCGL